MTFVIDAVNALVPGANVRVIENYPEYDIEWIDPPIAPVTDVQINEQYLKMNAAEEAKGLLSATDWTEVPSVSDPSKSPYLVNVDAFVAYRDALRVIAVTPTANPVWPVIPEEVWE